MKTSVALCTYNGEKYIAEQLDSILSQSTPVDEIIIYDDRSTDNTVSILNTYQKNHPNIFKIEINKKNLGYVKNFEKAMMNCSNDLIFLCDQDDIWLKNKVEKIKVFFEENPEKILISHKIDTLHNDDIISKSFWDKEHFNPQFTNQEILTFIIIYGNVFPGMTMCIRKKGIKKYLPFTNFDDKIIHDFEMIIKANKDNEFAIINEVLAHYRIHDKQNIGIDLQKMNTQKFSIQNKYHQIKKIKKICKYYNIDNKIIKVFNRTFKNEYQEHLKSLNLFQRNLYHLKNKYYYKILHEFK